MFRQTKSRIEPQIEGKRVGSDKSLSKDDGDTELKTNLYFTRKIRNYLVLCCTPMALKFYSGQISNIAINSKQNKHETLAVDVLLLQTTQSLIISRSCFSENGYECTKIKSTKNATSLPWPSYSLKLNRTTRLIVLILLVLRSSLRRKLSKQFHATRSSVFIPVLSTFSVLFESCYPSLTFLQGNLTELSSH